MTLDEAIQHTQEIADNGCDQCAKDHQQLAEWLTELKTRREEDTNSAKSMQLLHNDKRLCSIYNIKDGDILYYNINDDRWIFIFRDVNGIRNDMKKYHVLQYYAFCFEDIKDFVELKNSCVVDITKIKFANDEQKQILYDALKTYGYEWDPEIKKLIKTKKEIYFYPAGWDGDNVHGIPININGVYYETYIDTELAIRRGENVIHTTSMAHFHFDLIDLGYDIYVHYNGKKIKVEPGMSLISGKELRRGHNIRKIFVAHAFDEDFGIDYDKLEL